MTVDPCHDQPRTHALSIDVEEWYEAFETPPPEGERVSRIEETLDHTLELLDRAGHRATFFVVASMAERRPDLVPRIVSAGHEVGCHAWDHRRLTPADATAFPASVKRAADLLSAQAGRPIRGFRAPWWSLDASWTWALDALLDAGFLYDSSLFPGFAGVYGSLKNPTRPEIIHRRGDRVLWEIPPAPMRWGPIPLPAAGGIYTRLLPVWILDRVMAAWTRAGGRAVLYTHPWELDDDEPPASIDLFDRVIHNTARTGYRKKFAAWIERYPFAPIAEVFPEVGSVP